MRALGAKCIGDSKDAKPFFTSPGFGRGRERRRAGEGNSRKSRLFRTFSPHPVPIPKPGEGTHSDAQTRNAKTSQAGEVKKRAQANLVPFLTTNY